MPVLTYDLGHGIGLGVNKERTLQQALAHFHDVMKGKGGNVRLGPSLTSLFHRFFVLDPPVEKGKGKR